MNTTDQNLDHILHAFATTHAPVGLEQRISARLAQQSAEMHRHKPSLFDRIHSVTPIAPTPGAKPRAFAIASSALIVLAAACTLLMARTKPQQLVQQQTPTTVLRQESVQPQTAARTLPHRKTLHTAQPTFPVPAATQPPQDGPDAIALAETLAPSKPEPSMPLTAQETLLLRATRPGQPIEVAELDTLRESALSAIAASHERSSLLGYIHGLLGPLATAQALTPPSSQPDDSQTIADQELPSAK